MDEGGALCGGRPRLGPDGGGPDLISVLPEDLLLLVLRRIGCARGAVRTSLLSRHWRGLWKRIGDFTFHDLAFRSLHPVIDSLVLAAVVLLDIRVPEVGPEFSPLREEHIAHVSSLLRAAADLSPVGLRFDAPLSAPLSDHAITVHLPRFHRATFIDLHGLNLLFTELPAGQYMFLALETLTLSTCRADVHALVLQCPRMRVLRATGCLHGDEDMTVRSATLQELFVESWDEWTGRIDFEVPTLNRLVLKVLHKYSFPQTELNLAQEIEKQLVVTDFSVLKLHFQTIGHAFGAFLFCLLRIHWIRTAIKCLKIELQTITWKVTCRPNCRCDEPKNWRSQTISLINLEEVEIKGFEEEDYELDILRLIFKSAPMLKKMTVGLSSKVYTSNDWCEEVSDIFKAHPLVECSFDTSAELTNSSQTVVAT